MQQPTTRDTPFTAAQPTPADATRTPGTRRTGERRQVRVRRFAPLVTLAIVVALWTALTAARVFPPFILPPPLAVWAAFVEALADGTLARHTAVTLSEIALGGTLGVGVGITLGYALAKSRLLEALLSPVIVALQSTPVVAYAPLLVIWFRGDITGKVITCALIVFFPVLVSVIVGVRGVASADRDLLRSYGASPLATLFKLEIPAALPVVFGGLRTSATLAVIGAVVGEFVNADAGLGFLVRLARDQYDTALMIVAVIALALLARLLYAAVALLERLTLRYRTTLS